MKLTRPQRCPLCRDDIRDLFPPSQVHTQTSPNVVTLNIQTSTDEDELSETVLRTIAQRVQLAGMLNRRVGQGMVPRNRVRFVRHEATLDETLGESSN